MATFKNFKDLKRSVLSKAKQGVKDVVLPEVKKTMATAIDKYVYEVYEPKQYVRRYERPESGGLNDVDNVVDGLLSNETDNGFQYEISNLALPDGDGFSPTDYLTPLIVMGQREAQLIGYPVQYSGYGAYAEPRDFISPTIRQLKNSNVINKKLENFMSK